MKTVAIIQARMGSTRLPGKVMMDLGGRSILAWVVGRARRAQTLDDVIVATTTLDRDDVIVAECSALGVLVFRGSEDDVLDRYYRASEFCDADVVVRITADCPLIDPEVIDAVVSGYRDHQADYASNILERRFPRGLDVEVFSRAVLEDAWAHDDSAQGREHVTPYLYLNPGAFTLHSVEFAKDQSRLRWTVDTTEDLEVVRGIVAALGNRDDFGWQEALAVVEENPVLATSNRHVQQKALEGRIVRGPGNLLVRADAGLEIGTGHVMRCLALAQAWQDMGGHVTFVISAPPKNLRSRPLTERIDVVDLEADPASADDAEITVKRARELSAATVIDGYHFGFEFQKHIHGSVPSLLVIDDHGSIGSYRSDWILDQNLGADAEMYNQRTAKTSLLVGTTYALLRREFSKWRTARAKAPTCVRRVLVTFGGSDPGEMTRKVITALDLVEHQAFEVVAVLGMMNRQAMLSDPIDFGSRHRLNIVSDVSDMAALMRTVDLAIGAAGSTSWELACLGVPAVLTSMADNQRPIMAALQREGAAIGVTAEGVGFVERVARVVDALATDAERRALMSEKGMALVDGCGAARVAAKMSEAR